MFDAFVAEILHSCSGSVFPRSCRQNVKDFGKGIPSERIATFMQTGAGVGVGLVGMRERLKELGGSLEIKSEGVGTEVIATLPLHLRDGLTAESKFSAA